VLFIPRDGSLTLLLFNLIALHPQRSQKSYEAKATEQSVESTKTITPLPKLVWCPPVAESAQHNILTGKQTPNDHD